VRFTRCCILFLALAIVPSLLWAGEAPQAEAKMKLGRIKVQFPSMDMEFDAHGLLYEVEVARDAASGLPTGKRQHKPFTITKPVDKSTAMLLGALKNRTRFPEVLIEVGTSGKTRDPVYSITLHGVQVVSAKLPAKKSQVPVEEIAIVFEEIRFEYTESGTTHEDSWREQ
jgi:type VI secretion system secreted protein Hcp